MPSTRERDVRVELQFIRVLLPRNGGYLSDEPVASRTGPQPARLQARVGHIDVSFDSAFDDWFGKGDVVAGHNARACGLVAGRAAAPETKSARRP